MVTKRVVTNQSCRILRKLGVWGADKDSHIDTCLNCEQEVCCLDNVKPGVSTKCQGVTACPKCGSKCLIPDMDGLDCVNCGNVVYEEAENVILRVEKEWLEKLWS